MSTETIRLTAQGQSYGIAIGQFDTGGTVLSHDQVVQQRERQGLCVICGKVRTHILSTLMGRQQVTKEGESLFGWCLKCHTIEVVLSKPGLKSKAEKKKITWALKNNNNMRTSPQYAIGSSASVDTASTEETTSSSENQDKKTSRIEELCILDIVEELSSSINIAPLQERGCLELAKVALALQQSATAAELNAAIDAILSAMKAHPRDVEVQKSGCASLRKITSMVAVNNGDLSLDVCTKYVLRGGIFVLISAMRQHLQIRTIQREAINTLHIILQATSQRNKKLCIMSLNEFTALLDTMIYHSHCKSIQVASWNLIEVTITLEPVVRMLQENELLRSELVELANGQCPPECILCVRGILNQIGF